MLISYNIYKNVVEDWYIFFPYKTKNHDDFLETNFTTYKLSFRWMGKYLMRSKPCYIGTSLRDEFINNINNGVKYC